MPQPIASWNPTRDVWEGGQMNLFSMLSDVYSETLPTSGMTHSGQMYELPMLAPLTDANESSLLHTPRATMGGSSTENMAMLPTPVATDSEGLSRNSMGRNTPPLRAIDH